MTAAEFAQLCRLEKDQMLESYLADCGESRVSAGIASLGLDGDQMKKLAEVIDGVLTDTFYTLLLALDGGASLGGVQQVYRVHDEQGHLLSECGDLEAAAFEVFQES